jgi:hypothetical protein
MTEHPEFLNVLAEGIEAGLHIKILDLEQKNKGGRRCPFADQYTFVEYDPFFFLFAEQDKIRKFHSTSFKELRNEHLKNVVRELKNAN